MKNKTKIGQIAVLLLLIVPGGKYLSLPAILSEMVGRDAWLTVLTMLAIDAVGLTLVLYAQKLNQDGLSFFEVLSVSMSKAVAVVIILIFTATFILKASVLINSCYRLFAVTFSVKTGWFGYVLPLMLLAVFVVGRGFTAIGRLGELFAVLIVLSLAVILLFSSKAAHFDDIKPVLDIDASVFFNGLQNSLFWFGDYIFILFLMDSIKKEKKIFTAPLACFAVASVLIVFMIVLFRALFGELAMHIDLAMSKVSQYSVPASVSGRLDWLSMSIWVITLFLKIFVYVYCIYKCLNYLFCTSKAKYVLWQACLAVLPLIILPICVSIDEMSLSFMYGWQKYVFAVATHLLPFTLPLWVSIANKRNRLRSLKNGVS